MKKRLLILGMTLALGLTACGSKDADTTDDTAKEETTDTTEDTAETEDTVEKDTTPITEDTVESAGIDAFVTVGEYKGLTLTRTVSTITDQDVEDQVTSNLASNPVEMAEGIVQDGDTANIDYVGKIDGEEFEGGSAEGTDLVIGSNSFIEGFETGLIGMKAGETKDLDLTFPEDYTTDPTKAGKAVVFTVTVNKVSRPTTEITTEWLAANSTFTNADEYKADLKQSMQTQTDNSNEATLENEAWNQVYGTATFTQYPQDMVDEWTAASKAQYQSYADQYGVDLDTLLQAYSMTEDSLAEAAKTNVRYMLVLDSILDKEGIKVDDQTYTDKLNFILEQNNVTSKDEAIAAGVTECNIDLTVKYYIVLDILKENATITEAEETTEDTTADTADTSAE